MVIGLLLGFACWEASPLVLAWMSPVIAGLLLAVPMCWLTARPAGPVLRALLSTPDCRSPPAIVESARRAAGEWSLVGSEPAPEALAGAPRAA
jgi:membrane glycosyltransferase